MPPCSGTSTRASLPPLNRFFYSDLTRCHEAHTGECLVCLNNFHTHIRLCDRVNSKIASQGDLDCPSREFLVSYMIRKIGIAVATGLAAVVLSALASLSGLASDWPAGTPRMDVEARTYSLVTHTVIVRSAQKGNPIYT